MIWKRGRCVDEGSYKHYPPKHPYHYDYDDHYGLDAHRRTAFLVIFQRHRHQEKEPVPTTLSVNASLVPGPALCPGAGASERSQETL